MSLLLGFKEANDVVSIDAVNRPHTFGALRVLTAAKSFQRGAATSSDFTMLQTRLSQFGKTLALGVVAADSAVDDAAKIREPMSGVYVSLPKCGVTVALQLHEHRLVVGISIAGSCPCRHPTTVDVVIHHIPYCTGVNDLVAA